ncbi:IclR family transcriptional regulator [Blastococcus mobilis]|uniref:IclR family transcriptional regulator n=1 Tax=Blastococcus mobilis TaxID=1938746 RepID=UPI000B76D6B3|nr:IclR family transcriptional regulator [Blastococcus mobilis]
MGEEGSAPRRASVVSRTLSVLEAFDAEHHDLSLTDISRRSGLPIATCHRLVNELVTWRALVRVQGRYRIGHRLWALGQLSPVRRGLAETAAPYMHDVLFVTQNVVNLFIRDGGEALLVERISGTRPGPAVRQSGNRVPLHASAAGKVLLAYAPPDVVDDALREPVRLTPRTVTDPIRIRAELGKVRSLGYAESSGELAELASGIAVPIIALDGSVLAALGVVAVGAPLNAGSVVPVLKVAARAIARQVQAAGYGLG